MDTQVTSYREDKQNKIYKKWVRIIQIKRDIIIVYVQLKVNEPLLEKEEEHLKDLLIDSKFQSYVVYLKISDVQGC